MKARASPESIEIEGEIEMDRDLSWLVLIASAPCSTAIGRKVFLPKSQARIEGERQQGLKIVTKFAMPEWLAREKGLM